MSKCANFSHHILLKFKGLRFIAQLCVALLLNVILSLEVHGQALTIQLLRWTPSATTNSMIIPKLRSESPQEAIEAFLRSTSESLELQGLTIGDLIIGEEVRESIRSSRHKVEVLAPHETKFVLIVANRQSDHSRNDSRMQEFARVVEGSQSRFDLIPVGASLRLTEALRTEFHNLLAETFRTTIFMGGSDVHPAHYGEEITYARGTNYLRDFLEISLAKDLYLSKKGRLFGICRGAQLIAVALGYKLIQDVNEVIKSTFRHGSGLPGGPGFSHEMFVERTTGMWIATMKGLFVEGILKVGKIIVNSLHHQSIVWTPGGPLAVAGRAPDGTVEWAETLDGRVILRQDHPEKPSEGPPDVQFFRNLIRSNFGVPRIHCGNLL